MSDFINSFRINYQKLKIFYNVSYRNFNEHLYTFSMEKINLLLEKFLKKIKSLLEARLIRPFFFDMKIPIFSYYQDKIFVFFTINNKKIIVKKSKVGFPDTQKNNNKNSKKILFSDKMDKILNSLTKTDQEIIRSSKIKAKLSFSKVCLDKLRIFNLHFYDKVKKISSYTKKKKEKKSFIFLNFFSHRFYGKFLFFLFFF
ncbi:hypothetical protein CMESO_317 (nucleomorph) [Chroomonas mesostigmatica CCMP1168]|uniref:Uncharacterized protein n=1 Tax=Chroomonas mesostigmatica CCMP1168 TaxID=1195612 RepID=J7GAI3_9CRYP|nr:hypothetical protein CMESO_317 [Chroomonas mesostigmatica CCMP1168]